MSVLTNRLTRDHHRFARIMSLLEALLERFHAGDEPDYELMCELMEYIVDYADQVHHPGEELIFAAMTAKLTESGSDAKPQVRQTIDDLLGQHQRLAEAGQSFRDAIEGIVHETVLSRDAVEADGRALVELLRSHIAIEESQVFPAALDLLDSADWDRLDQAAPRAEDPVFGQLDPLRFRALYEHLKDELQSESPD